MADPTKGVVELDGTDFRWSVFRQPTWTMGRTHGYTLLGLAVLVEPPEPGHRKLVLEFDIEPRGDMPQHQRFHANKARLIEAIKDAISAGWEPDSRGKRFVYEAGSLQRR